MTTINQVHTPCKNCVFAIYNNNTQTDCHLNFIDKYKNKNTEIIEAYDEEKEFYIINGRKCLGFRQNDWFKDLDMENASIEEKITKFKEINKLNYLAVVDLQYLNLTQFENVCKQFNDLDIKPKKIIYIRHTNTDLNFSYETMKATIEKFPPGCVWRIQTIIDNDLMNEQILHSIINLNTKYRFILSIPEFTNSIQDIIKYTNQLVYEDLGSFKIIANKDKNCLIFSGIVYRFANKTTNQNILSHEEFYDII
jgi:hypothetical protein